MAPTASFPSETSAGTLFVAERCFCLDDTLFDWLGDAQGEVSLPDSEQGFVGIVLKEDVPLRKEVLGSLDPAVVKLVYFHNPFELLSVAKIMIDDFMPEWVQSIKEPGDEECQILSRLEGLKAIDLATSKMTDEGLADLCRLSSLESLVICDAKITGEGLRHLSRLTCLRELDLGFNAFGSEALGFLSDLPELIELRLSDTGLDDDALPYLVKLTDLKFLDVADTAISDEGVSLLREELPECDVWP